MIKRIKNLIELSKYIPNSASSDELKVELNGHKVIMLKEDLGDGKAVFFGEGSAKEFKEQEEKDKGFMGKIFGV